MKPGDRVRLVSLDDRDKLAVYLFDPPANIGDVGKIIREDEPGKFICGFLKYVLLVNKSMVKVIRAH